MDHPDDGPHRGNLLAQVANLQQVVLPERRRRGQTASSAGQLDDLDPDRVFRILPDAGLQSHELVREVQ